MTFAIFFVAEYVNDFDFGAGFVFFFGGWLSPFEGISWWPEVLKLPGFHWLAFKVSIFLFLYLWFARHFPLSLRPNHALGLENFDSCHVGVDCGGMRADDYKIGPWSAGHEVVMRTATSIIKTFSLRVLVGMGVTLRQMFPRPNITIQYPEEKTPQSPRFRGLHATSLR